jgi:NAD+ kinase
LKIAVIPNLTKERSEEISKDIASWLLKFGADFGFADKHADIFGGVRGAVLMPETELIEWCDVVITVGGDGSVLNAAKKALRFSKPILGINAGRLAFLAGLENNELYLLKDLIEGNFIIDKRMLLDAKLIRNGETVADDLCINDVVLARGQMLKMTDIHVDCDGRRISTYRADGVIIATPTGSTAYSLSAGGPVINPSIDAVLLTPICTQSLFARSIVFSSDNEIVLYPEETSYNTNLYLSFDGGDSIDVIKGDKIVIQKSDSYAQFIRIKQEEFFDVLNNKLADRRV